MFSLLFPIIGAFWAGFYGIGLGLVVGLVLDAFLLVEAD